ncbi:MAG: Crp/Fnr family transcriptional regulator [Marinobacter sp.]|nr:Crp/Fnr family transcriptional regulator [Marinobacter sp.]
MMATSTFSMDGMLAQLEADTRTRLLEGAQRVALPAGRVVFRAGDACQGLPLVLSGVIRVQMTGASGNSIVLYRIGEQDVCTLSVGCLMAARGYRAEAVVEEAAEVLILPLALFEELMAASPKFRREMMAAYGRRLDDLMLLVEEVAFRRMDDRLEDWLALRGSDTVIDITHQALAEELGTAREVVSRLLKELERQGRVSLGRGRIEVRVPFAR